MKFKDLDLSKSYTYADYLTWNFFERIELIRGKIFKMSPAPSTHHQQIVMDLSAAIYHFLQKRPCKVFTAPFDVCLLLPPHQITDEQIDTVVQPDICVFCNTDHIRRRGAFGPPDWIIEILSPSTAKKDKNDKYELYEFAGVKEYWLVDPMNKTLLINSLNEEGQYLNLGPFYTTHTVQPVLFPQLNIDLNEIFPDVDYVEEDWGDNYIRM